MSRPVEPPANSSPDPRAEVWARAFEQEMGFVQGFFRRHGFTASDAEDLTQDVFVVMCRRWSDYQADRPLRPWLAGIAARVAMKRLERRQREVSLEPGGAAAQAPLPDQQLESSRALGLARRALAALPERHRTALILHDLDEISARELAAIWAVPLFTVYTRVRVARRAFARVVADLQAQGGPDHRQAPLAPATLLSLEREAPRVPAAESERLRARLRGLLLVPPAEWPKPALDLPPRPRAPLVTAPLVGVAVLGLVGLVLVGRHQPVARSFEIGSAAAGPPVVAKETRAPLSVRPALPKLITSPPAREEGAPARPTRAQVALARGLMGAWRFEDPRGDTRVRDTSGRHRDCAVQDLHRTAWIDGVRGNGLQLGTGHLECPLPAAVATSRDPITVAAWAKPDVTPGHHTLVSRPGQSRTREYFSFGWSNGALHVHGDFWRVRLDVPFSGAPDQWVHVAFTHSEDGTTRLYLGGVEVAKAKSRRRDSVAVSGPLYLGVGVPPPGSAAIHPFAGATDDVLVYDRALSKREVRWLAHGAFPLEATGAP